MIRMRALGLAAAPLLLFTVACGDDGGGDPEAFCDKIEEYEDDGSLQSQDPDESLEAFDDLAEDAPGELQDDLDTLRDAYEEAADLDPEDAGQAFEILLSEEVFEATQNFAQYLEDECGIENPIEGSGSDLTDALSDLEDLSDLDLTTDVPDDFSSDFSDDFSSDFSDDQSEDDESAASRLRTFLEDEYPDLEDLIEGIGSVDLSEDEVQVNLTVGDEPADEDTGVEICEAVLEFAEDDGLSDIEVEVANDENGDDAELATGSLDDGCEAA